MPAVVQFAPDTFGAWLQRRGFENLKAVPALYRTAAQRLNTGDIAPNSPILPRFANELGVSLETLQPFAKAAPLDARWVQKIETQLAKGTLPRGSKTHHRKAGPKAEVRAKGHRRSNNAGPLAKLLVERSGMPVSALAEKLGISHATMGRLCAGQLAGNHPPLAPLAKALKLDVKVLTKYMHGPRLNPQAIKATLSKLRPRLKKVAAATVEAPHGPRAAKPAKAKPTTAAGKRYNK